MKRLNDRNLLESYVREFELDKMFQRDMRPYMNLMSFERGECICNTGDELEYFYFNVYGKLKVYTLMENGKSLLLRFNKPLSIVGDVEFMSGYSIKCNVDSLNESHLIGISVEDISKHALKDPVFLGFVIKNLGYKLYTISNSTSINLLYPLEKRFASYIISISGEDAASKEANEIRTTSMTEMATLLGTSYRHLNRVIRELSDSGIVSKRNGKISVLDYTALKGLAGELLYE
ncbi:MAG TPA: cyclic nucleotide-binding domain-containing protein [Negativicutes bacterium]|nr:cyclic nucleotide-binding domain-containing protein [Negativicutes bacterium]